MKSQSEMALYYSLLLSTVVRAFGSDIVDKLTLARGIRYQTDPAFSSLVGLRASVLSRSFSSTDIKTSLEGNFSNCSPHHGSMMERF